MKEKIAITIGDASGIGPEIIAKALIDRTVVGGYIPVVIGNQLVMEDGIKIAGASLRVHVISSPDEAIDEENVINVMDIYPEFDIKQLQYGLVQKDSGLLAYKSIKSAIKLALANKVAAVVTAPINKESFMLAGSPYPGHTEMFADLTGTRKYSMILMYDKLRIAHVTTHVSMLEAIGLIKTSRILETIQVAHTACVQLGISNPTIAVAGLNPHAGENGMFGREEIDEIVPAIRQAKSERINVLGPVSADTLFSKAVGGLYDCIVAMYHDQGHIPIKLLGFSLSSASGAWKEVKGVNITFGLPVVRVSVDHGTAFGKAGKGTANASSMVEAVQVAVKLAQRHAHPLGTV